MNTNSTASTHSIQSYFHDDTSTFTHVLTDIATGQCAIIDPVLDYDAKSGRTSTDFIDQVLAGIAESASTLVYVLETHAHADHLTSAAYIRQRTGAKIVIGQQITSIQHTFSGIFNESERFPTDGSQFDVLLAAGDEITLGKTHVRAIATPGHTPACVTYLVDDTDAFIGDTLFMPDTGTARCDFPGGDANALYDSVQTLFALGDDINLHLCHDYPPTDRAVCSVVTVAEQKAKNIHVGNKQTRDSFIELRTQRDAGLAVPRLILPSLQVNIRAGDFPAPEDNGVSYLKIPLNKI
jgi:glyoxylase-like metal-dependent hydrolase (beta-lactamase superfamily II)